MKTAWLRQRILGVVIAAALLSVVGGGIFGLNSTLLTPIFLVIAIIQFLFLGLIESSRPKYLV